MVCSSAGNLLGSRFSCDDGACNAQAKDAIDRGEKFTYTVTEQHISNALGDLLKKKDLSKYIL